MPTSIGAYQSSLVLNETIEIQGAYPSRDGNGGTTLGMLHTYAFGFGMSAAPMALGQLMPLSQNTALFSILGTTYGGNGVTNFALPNLAGRTAISPGQGPGLSDVSLGGQTGSATTVLTQAQLPASVGGASAALNENQPELGLQYLIRVEGIFPGQDSGGGALNMIGAVVKFAGGFIPGSYMACDGQLLQISQYEELFTLIGTTFGGDGQTTFALPDLRGRTIVGASGNHQLGQVFGSENLTIGQSNLPVAMGGSGVALDNHEPSLALNYLIALQGVFPSSNGAASETDPMFGEVVAFAGNFAPRGFAFAQGQLLPINQNQALFSLLGTTYGGNGQTTFALPDLRDKDVVGQGSGFALGDKIGSDSITLTLDNIPNLTYSGTDAGATHYGGNGDDVINALGGVDTIITNGGNDTITGGAGSDTINGGPGVDVAVFSGHHGNYAINYNSTTQAFTVADQRGGSPDGSDTVSQVELFQFSDGLFVPNQAGGSTQTLADLAGVVPWLSQVSSFDAVGSLTSQTINNDNNTHVTNDYDTAGAVAWTWRTSSYDSSGRLVSQTGLNDDGTH